MYYEQGSIDVTTEDLLKAMKGEKEAIMYYKKLSKMAPDQKQKEMIEGFMQDEKKHYGYFNKLYYEMTGKEPQIEVKEPVIKSYIRGIEQSILDELEAYEFYRDIYLGSHSPIVRNIFFEAFTDENEHASHFNYLYTKNKK